MLEAIFDCIRTGSPAARSQLLPVLEAFTREVQASRGGGDRRLLLQAEEEVRAAPGECFRFDAAGEATLYAGGQRYAAGRFEVLSLRELQARAQLAQARSGQRSARLRVCICDGAGPATDIGALQAFAPPRTLFQVASQFNCLEAPGAFITEVADYLHDPTQGPRASVSAFPGTLLRHYAAPDATPNQAAAAGDSPTGAALARRLTQTTDGPQINLLAAACRPGIAAVRSGYLRPDDIRDPAAFASLLEDRFDQLCVGAHDGVQVVLGAEWDGAVSGSAHRRIAQVFTSTMAAGMYGDIRGGDPNLPRILQALQRLAYLGTLLTAAAHGKDFVVLTLIGGGVFGNPVPVIWGAITWALAQVRAQLHRDLFVVVNGRNLGEHIDRQVLADYAHAHEGLLLRFGKTAIEIL